MTTLASMPYATGRRALEAKGKDEVAVLLDGMHLVMHREDGYDLEREGVEFAYLGWMNLGDDRRIVVTIPVND